MGRQSDKQITWMLNDYHNALSFPDLFALNRKEHEAITTKCALWSQRKNYFRVWSLPTSYITLHRYTPTASMHGPGTSVSMWVDLRHQQWQSEYIQYNVQNIKKIKAVSLSLPLPPHSLILKLFLSRKLVFHFLHLFSFSSEASELLSAFQKWSLSTQKNNNQLAS